PQTLANWKRRLDEHGEAALVQLVRPVNRFPDQVRQLVGDLKRTFPTMGRQRMADSFARAGLVLAASTVRRISLEAPPQPTEPPSDRPTADDTPGSANTRRPAGIEARCADPVWHCDLAVVPTALGFWLPWFPFAGWLGWPFAYWVVGVVDQ